MSPTRSMLAAYYLLAILLACLAYLGQHSYAGSSYALNEGKKHSAGQSFWLFVHVLVTPFSALLLVLVLGHVHADRTLGTPVRLLLPAISGVVLCVLAGLEADWGGGDMLACGLIFCTGPVNTDNFEGHRNGWRTWAGR